MALGNIVELAAVGIGLYLVYSMGYLDQAGQALVQATAKKQGYSKHKKVKIIYPPPPPVIVAPPHNRMRLTVA